MQAIDRDEVANPFVLAWVGTNLDATPMPCGTARPCLGLAYILGREAVPAVRGAQCYKFGHDQSGAQTRSTRELR